eukprot:m.189724 g.189724  ORF g.189724 m.189724 type:complete len:56 (+) comp24861_c0_seq18:215-382(+)
MDRCEEVSESFLAVIVCAAHNRTPQHVDGVFGMLHQTPISAAPATMLAHASCPRR